MKRLLLILIIAISALYPQNITVDNNKDFDKALSLYNSKNTVMHLISLKD